VKNKEVPPNVNVTLDQSSSPAESSPVESLPVVQCSDAYSPHAQKAKTLLSVFVVHVADILPRESCN
jgi:hypothetical protein